MVLLGQAYTLVTGIWEMSLMGEVVGQVDKPYTTPDEVLSIASVGKPLSLPLPMQHDITMSIFSPDIHNNASPCHQL